MQRRQLAYFYFFMLLLSFYGCTKAEGNFQILSSSVSMGELLHLNEPIEFKFNKAVDLSSVSFANIAIAALPPQNFGAPTAGPVQGQFFLKPGSQARVLVFQPFCSTNPGFQSGGLIPGNVFGAVNYEVNVLALSEASAAIRAQDGTQLTNSYNFIFHTPIPPNPLFVDPNPSGPPTPIQTNLLPKSLGLNLFLNPINLIVITLDQPVLASTVDENAVRLEFTHPTNGSTIVVPCSVTVLANCNFSNQAVLSVMPRGILPSGQSIRFYLSKNIQGLGNLDFRTTDLLFHTATVAWPSFSPQKDAILEEFNSADNFDPTPNLLVPLAKIENGLLQAAERFPSSANNIEIEIGPGTTNGPNVYFSTDGGVLKDTQGYAHIFPDGVIEVAKFTLKSPTLDEGSIFKITGSKPLILRTTEECVIEEGAFLSIDGQTAPDVAGLHVANFPSYGGVGNAGGGDGGTGSPLTTQSDPKGGDGNGAFNLAGLGGEGGHSAFGSTNPYDTRCGGGGGGNWGIRENFNGNLIEFCYGGADCTDCASCAPPCEGFSPITNSNGENGNTGVNNSQDAVVGTLPALGGNKSPAVFADGMDENNFFGKKPSSNGLIFGELTVLQGGAGGGAGGDNVPSLIFPSGQNFWFDDCRGAGGGGGAGALSIQALGALIVRGNIRANGGSGGAGEEMNFGHPAAGGGGGGAGGMIVLESASYIQIGINASITARGGDRGVGGGNAAGTNGSSNNCKKKNNTAARGGAGGKGVIQLHVAFDANTEPSIQNGALLVESENGVQTVNFERSEFLVTHFDPKPHVLIPNFGDHSAALSRWFTTGFASLSSPPQFDFFETMQTLASGYGGSVSNSLINLEDSTLADAIRSEPKLLIADLFQPNPNAPNYTIQNAWVSGNVVSLLLDSTNLPPVENWKIYRRYFQTTINGMPGVYPNSCSAKILFEGAEETEPGSGIPNTDSILGPTANIESLLGKTLLRFRVEFTTQQNEEIPGLQFLKIPYQF